MPHDSLKVEFLPRPSDERGNDSDKAYPLGELVSARPETEKDNTIVEKESQVKARRSEDNMTHIVLQFAVVVEKGGMFCCFDWICLSKKEAALVVFDNQPD